jgi:hypothetical protein
VAPSVVKRAVANKIRDLAKISPSNREIEASAPRKPSVERWQKFRGQTWCVLEIPREDELPDIFNRTEMPNPGGGPTTPTTHANPADPNSALTGGFGLINYGSIGSSAYPPRQGTLEMRFQF